MRRETLRHLDTPASISNLGMLLKAKGDLAAAGPLLHEALEGRRETLAHQHPDTLATINNQLGLLQATINNVILPPCFLLTFFRMIQHLLEHLLFPAYIWRPGPVWLLAEFCVESSAVVLVGQRCGLRYWPTLWIATNTVAYAVGLRFWSRLWPSRL